MADISRDTFQLTNAMHQLLTGQAVTDPRHYVGVRMQQGVPLLDSDWNEFADIGHQELRAILKYFVGTGVPAGDQGFEISESGDPNDFAIGQGVMLHDGLMAINLGFTSHANQPEGAGLISLSTPAADRVDIVYLDLWEDEIGATGAPDGDDRLINQRIGIETSTRQLRHWIVRVEEDASDLTALAVPDGHRFLPIALLERRAGVDSVRDSMIVDLRKRGITLSDHLKVPIDLRRGLEVLDVQRYAQMLKGLRTTLFQRLRDENLPYSVSGPDSERIENVVLMGLQELMTLARVGEVQALGRSMDNDDALRFLNDLYDEQVSWLELVEDIANDGDTVPPFLAEYRIYLNGSPVDLIKGVRPALDQNDLLNGVIAQETLNLWLTQSTGNLPQGSVDAVYQSAIPADENLTAGLSHDFTYSIQADFTSPQTSEDFQVQVTLPSAFGTAVVDQSTLNFSPPSGQSTVTVTVDPSGGTSSADMDVSIIAVRNATLRSPQPPITLTLNALPPIAAFFYYAGTRLNADGRLEIPQDNLTRPQGRNILYRISNDSPTETRTYEVLRRIVPVGDTTGWEPVADEATGPPITVAPNSQFDVLARVDGPKDPDPGPPPGTVGDIVTTATLTLIDGAPPADSQAPVIITIPFIVI